MRKTNSKKQILWVVLILAALVVFGGMGVSNYWIATGTLELLSPAGTVVFIDGARIASGVPISGSEVKTQKRLSAGEHTIIVASDAGFPWKKDLIISKDGVTRVHPFQVAKQIKGVRIPESDPEYGKLMSLIEAASVPSKVNPLTSRDGTTRIWVEQNIIYWELLKDAPLPLWCEKNVCDTPVAVMPTLSPINSLAFLNERNDVLVVSVGGKIIAIEADKRGAQNIAPILEGTAPRFLITDSNLFLIKDGRDLAEITL